MTYLEMLAYQLDSMIDTFWDYFLDADDASVIEMLDGQVLLQQILQVGPYCRCDACELMDAIEHNDASLPPIPDDELAKLARFNDMCERGEQEDRAIAPPPFVQRSRERNERVAE